VVAGRPAARGELQTRTSHRRQPDSRPRRCRRATRWRVSQSPVRVQRDLRRCAQRSNFEIPSQTSAGRPQRECRRSCRRRAPARSLGFRVPRSLRVRRQACGGSHSRGIFEHARHKTDVDVRVDRFGRCLHLESNARARHRFAELLTDIGDKIRERRVVRVEWQRRRFEQREIELRSNQQRQAAVLRLGKIQVATQLRPG
jgi:hypothetical protein